MVSGVASAGQGAAGGDASGSSGHAGTACREPGGAARAAAIINAEDVGVRRW